VPKANELKQGTAIEINGEPYIVKKIEVRNPSSRGAATLYKVRYAHMKTKQKLDESYKSDDMLKAADCSRVPVQFSYQDGDTYHFMHSETYEQYSLSSEDIEEQIDYLSEGLEGIVLLLMDDIALGVELPTTITLQIVETPPAMKGASATSRTKPAKLSTGLEIQVPEYIESDELVKVNTETGKFMSRA
jgi:elongation factor P